jgi:hypothetical protein
MVHIGWPAALNRLNLHLPSLADERIFHGHPALRGRLRRGAQCLGSAPVGYHQEGEMLICDSCNARST